MKNWITEDVLSCFECDYKGKFFKGWSVNKKESFLLKIFNGKDWAVCPVCGEGTTPFMQIFKDSEVDHETRP